MDVIAETGFQLRRLFHALARPVDTVTLTMAARPSWYVTSPYQVAISTEYCIVRPTDIVHMQRIDAIDAEDDTLFKNYPRLQREAKRILQETPETTLIHYREDNQIIGRLVIETPMRIRHMVRDMNARMDRYRAERPLRAPSSKPA